MSALPAEDLVGQIVSVEGPNTPREPLHRHVEVLQPEFASLNIAQDPDDVESTSVTLGVPVRRSNPVDPESKARKGAGPSVLQYTLCRTADLQHVLT